MANLIIEIHFGNDAMVSYEQAREAIYDKLRTGALRPKAGDCGFFSDVNGNRVGSWEVVDEGLFVAVGHNIVKEDETVGSARSKTMAVRIANALNKYVPGDRGY